MYLVSPGFTGPTLKKAHLYSNSWGLIPKMLSMAKCYSISSKELVFLIEGIISNLTVALGFYVHHLGSKGFKRAHCGSLEL